MRHFLFLYNFSYFVLLLRESLWSAKTNTLIVNWCYLLLFLIAPSSFYIFIVLCGSWSNKYFDYQLMLTHTVFNLTQLVLNIYSSWCKLVNSEETEFIMLCFVTFILLLHESLWSSKTNTTIIKEKEPK